MNMQSMGEVKRLHLKRVKAVQFAEVLKSRFSAGEYPNLCLTSSDAVELGIEITKTLVPVILETTWKRIRELEQEMCNLGMECSPALKFYNENTVVTLDGSYESI